jgi:hypothetical protein
VMSSLQTAQDHSSSRLSLGTCYTSIPSNLFADRGRNILLDGCCHSQNYHPTEAKKELKTSLHKRLYGTVIGRGLANRMVQMVLRPGQKIILGRVLGNNVVNE